MPSEKGRSARRTEHTICVAGKTTLLHRPFCPRFWMSRVPLWKAARTYRHAALGWRATPQRRPTRPNSAEPDTEPVAHMTPRLIPSPSMPNRLHDPCHRVTTCRCLCSWRCAQPTCRGLHLVGAGVDRPELPRVAEVTHFVHGFKHLQDQSSWRPRSVCHECCSAPLSPNPRAQISCHEIRVHALQSEALRRRSRCPRKGDVVCKASDQGVLSFWGT